MKSIIHIARSEFRSLFYSPLAWVLLLALYLLSILMYFDGEKMLMQAAMRGGYSLTRLQFLTNQVLGMLLPTHPFSLSLISFLYVLLPLVTMGVISREFRNGTDKLLFSAPIRTRQLVFGKFLGIMAFNGGIIVSVGLVLLCTGLSVSQADWGILVATLFGFYLLIMLLSAIGLYISSLTSYPVVAGLVTLVAFGFLFNYLTTTLEFLGRLLSWGDIDFVIKFRYVEDYIRMQKELTHGKVTNFTNGLLNSRDIIYFFNLSAIFIAFTLIHLKSKRQHMSFGRKVSFHLLVLASAVLVGYVSSNPYLLRITDITREQVHTIHSTTQHTLAGMDKGPLHITYYINLFDPYAFALHPHREVDSYNYWEAYRRFKPDIHITYEYYYDHRGGEPGLLALNPGLSEQEIAAKYAGSTLIPVPLAFYQTPQEMAGKIDLSFEQYRNVVQLEYQGKKTFLRHFPIPPNPPLIPYRAEEREVAPALHRLIGKQPCVLFSTGNGESSPEGIGVNGLKDLLNDPIRKFSMINQGLDNDTINLLLRGLPDTTRMLAICDPRFPLSEAYLSRVEHYLQDGRNMLIMFEPEKRANVAPLLALLGLQTRPGILGYESLRASGEQVRAHVTHAAKAFSTSLSKHIEQETFYRKDSLWLTFHGAVALEQVRDAGFQATPLVVLDTVNGFNRPSALDQAALEGKQIKVAGDEIAPFSLGYVLTRSIHNREQRIVVLGDADSRSELLSDLYAPHLFGWLSDEGYPLDLVKPAPLDKAFNVSPTTVGLRKGLWIYGVSGLLALIASLVLIRRNRR